MCVYVCVCVWCVSQRCSHHVGCDEDLKNARLLVHKSSSVSNVVSQPYVQHSGGISGGGYGGWGEGGLDWISNGEEFTLMEQIRAVNGIEVGGKVDHARPSNTRK